MTQENIISLAIDQYAQMLNGLKDRFGLEFALTVVTESLLMTLANMDPEYRQEFLAKIKCRIEQIGTNFFEDKEDYLDFVSANLKDFDE